MRIVVAIDAVNVRRSGTAFSDNRLIRRCSAGGIENRDVNDIVKSLVESTGALCNESSFPTVMDDMEIHTMSESIKSLAYNHYVDKIDDGFEDMLREDASGTAQMFINNIADIIYIGEFIH